MACGDFLHCAVFELYLPQNRAQPHDSADSDGSVNQIVYRFNAKNIVLSQKKLLTFAGGRAIIEM
ncbi:MAG: hypothetical protein PUH36_04140 [Subdoligranulum sp.]|nr:hypothetical protein [Subdoligranulum sp.]